MLATVVDQRWSLSALEAAATEREETSLIPQKSCETHISHHTNQWLISNGMQMEEEEVMKR